MDKSVDIFMDYHQICLYIRAKQLHGELVVTVYFIKFQFPSCDRTLSILRRIKGNTVVCVFNASVKHRVPLEPEQNIHVNPQTAVE